MRDYTDDLSAVENSLRLIIEHVGREKFGENFLQNLGVNARQIKEWEKGREKDATRRGAGIRESRILHFSSFFELEQIVISNWNLFEPVFGRFEHAKVFLEKLRDLRNPDAHRRELTTTEKSLISGMSGEIRTQITRYLSDRESPNEYFPRMETLQDSLGTSMNSPRRPVVRVGALIEFVAEAWDPFAAELQYKWTVQPSHPESFQDWSANNRFAWSVKENQVANPAWVNVAMRSPREFHAEGSQDASWSIAYTVLPAR